MRPDLPSGTVTFMFTDIEGSTAMLHDLGPNGYAAALKEHRDVLREAFTAHGGVEVDTQGDAFFVAFPTVTGAVRAAADAQSALALGRVRVRMGLHTGTPLLTAEGYVGEDVHLGARIASAGHGGQVLLSASTRAAVDVEVTHLGEHKLKDFEVPVPIYQLGSGVFPLLKTVTATNLPRPASVFVGRESQLHDVLSLLREGARLLTLTAPGGSGKTRLAIEVATELVGTVKAGVFWVGLAPLRDAALVLPAIGQAIGAKGDVTEHIGQREMVLLVDNVEHLVAAAPELANLVERCPHLTLLVTSRELLRVRGEVGYDVPPLDSVEAVELFCVRSGRPADDDVAELCHRLDNLPLAVELAAARARVLSPRQILDRISQRLDLLRGGRDAEGRQQTLRATIDWSHALLSPDEQRLFARLAVFAGGSSVETAEVVTGADVDLLASLLDKSLLRNTDGRFLMLETIRDYATERLEASGEAEVLRRAHAEHFVAMSEAAEPDLMGPQPKAALDRLEAEDDNLRAALDWLERSGDVQGALRMAGALWEYWCLRVHFGEGWRRLDHLLSLDDTRTVWRAKALTGAAHLAPGTGQPPAAGRVRVEQALELQRQVGSAWDIAFAEHQYALQFADEGDFETCLPLVEKCVERWREVGDDHRELQAMRITAWAADSLGDGARFARLHEEILRRALLIGDVENECWSRSCLGMVAIGECRFTDAIQLFKATYDLQVRIDEPAVDMTVVRVGIALATAEKFELAAEVFGLAEAMADRADFVYQSWFAAMRDKALDQVRAALREQEFTASWQRGRTMSPGEAFQRAAVAVAGVPVGG